MSQVYANGIRNIDLHFIIRKLAAPVIAVLLVSLCVPYVIATGVVPVIGMSKTLGVCMCSVYVLIYMENITGVCCFYDPAKGRSKRGGQTCLTFKNL